MVGIQHTASTVVILNYYTRCYDASYHLHNLLMPNLWLSLLRAILSDRRVKYSFRELKETILSVNAVEGFYEHEEPMQHYYVDEIC